MDWEKSRERLLNLLQNNRLSELRGALMMLNEVDIAHFMEELDKEKLLIVFRVLPKDISADVFSYMSAEQKQTLVECIGDSELRALIEDMFLDDAVDFLDELPANVVKRILQSTDEKTRNLINQFLRYPDNSAGSLMTIEYMEIHTGTSMRQAMDIIRKTGVDKETIYTLYILDEARRLRGTLPLRTMILAQDDVLVETLMTPNPVFVRTLDDQEKVAEMVREYDLLSIPVLDKEDRMVGIITADDIMDVIEEENTEDFEKMAALTPSEDEYLKTSPLKLAWNRIPWLLIMATVAIFTGMIITKYENLLSGAAHIGVILTSCIPMLMDTGGNCGSQASTQSIRGIALGQIEFKDIFRALWKELRVALMVGGVLFLFTFFRIIFINLGGDWSGWWVALIVALSLLCTVVLAKSLGCILPLAAKKIGFDPALMASPLITTIVDFASLSVYFTIATAIMARVGI